MNIHQWLTPIPRIRVSGLILLFTAHLSPLHAVTPYGPVAAERYVTGRYKASTHPDFISLEDMGIPTGTGTRYLRKEAAQAFSQMISALHQVHPDVQVQVISAHRDFGAQKYIWQAKWTGQRRSGGLRLNLSHPDPVKRAKKILRFSAMPGASRHHWGTEVDINSLRNSYFENGKGLVLYRWLTKNASGFGFCQPYSSGRQKGHAEEKWHWSYRPLARRFQETWESLYSNNPETFIRHADFIGNKAAAAFAAEYQESINPDCK